MNGSIKMSDTKTPLISVIIPIYKSEKYLSQCISSIINQTYKNIEILCIDDGSPDSSGKICKDFGQKDNRVKTITQSNKGVGAARNLGINNASGELISFIDSDDYLENDFYEYLWNIMNSTNADIAYCDFTRINEKGQNLSKVKKDNNAKTVNIYSSKEAVINSLKSKTGFGMYSWNGLYKKHIVPFFGEGRPVAEDQDFTVHVLLNAKSIARGSERKYNYRVYNSQSKKTDPLKGVEYQHTALKIMKNHLEEANADAEMMNAYYDRCFKMDICLLDRYCTNIKNKHLLFKSLKMQCQKDVEILYPGFKGRLLSFFLGIGEPFYKLIFFSLHLFQR